MNIHISVVGGLIVAAFYVGSARLLWKLGRYITNTRLRLVLVSALGILLLALPWSEELWIAWKFKTACESAGMFVRRNVRVEGFLDRSATVPAKHAREGLITSPGTIRDFDRLGCRFIEYPITNGKVLHEQRTGDGLKVTILGRPEAQYAFRINFDNVPIRGRILCAEESVVEMQSQRVIATYRGCGRTAGALAFDPYPIEFCPSRNGRLRAMLCRRILVPRDAPGS